MTVSARAVCFCLLVAWLLAGPALSGRADAQYFGRNKVEYHDFQFRTLQTEHFDIYYYPREEQAVRDAARMAERWYARLSQVLDHRFSSRQPLILYGSHPEFSQTNVISQFLDESIGGVTESVRRRIALPFAPGLAETDHVLGHEIVHAFQIDILKNQKRQMVMPLWFAEGMAEYLSVGPVDAMTATWVRDSAEHGTLPSLKTLSGRGVSPYRFGHSLWAYLAGRFGDSVIQQVLHLDEKGGAIGRIERVSGVKAAALSADWRAAVLRDVGPVLGEFRGRVVPPPVVGALYKSRLNIAPALSPDGRELIFLSEKDHFSVDLFLADASTGVVVRKLLTRTADQRLESLQFVNSSGAWDPEGRRFMMSAVRGGIPVLLLVDARSGKREEEIQLPELGEIFTPTWSPDGNAVAFAALVGGVTDLYLYDLKTRQLRQLTRDHLTDLQPAWSPDGRQLAFVTDRFSSDLPSLRFGALQLALYDLDTQAIRPVSAFESVKHIDPHWSSDGTSLFFVSTPFGINNVFRVNVSTGTVRQVTDVATGVMGLTASSPALSVARSASRVAFSMLRNGRYEIHVMDSPEALAGRPAVAPPFVNAAVLSPHEREGAVAAELSDVAFGLPAADERPAGRYVPTMSLEGFGQPYLSSGGSRLGTFIRGGTSFLFGDMLGERKLGAALQIGTRQEDFAAQLRYLNRARRWNWGAAAEVLPYVRGGSRNREGREGEEPVFSKETERFRQMHGRMRGFLSYPFSRAQRFELSSGVRHITSARLLRSRVFSSNSRRLIRDVESKTSGGRDVTLSETSAALIYDSAVWGPAGPLLGTRSRLEFSPSLGGLSFTSVLADYRRYLMPIRPYTLATRLQYAARYGRDANDPHLEPHFVGYRNLVRGYDFSSLIGGCTSTLPNECDVVDRLTGSRSLIANIELRFPLFGILSRSHTYGRVPLDGVLFADGGLAGGGDSSVWPRRHRLARSVGASVRIAPFGFVAEIGAVRTFDHPSRRWAFLFDFRPGF
jgi:Tol biopolymer transport system component